MDHIPGLNPSVFNMRLVPAPDEIGLDFDPSGGSAWSLYTWFALGAFTQI